MKSRKPKFMLTAQSPMRLAAVLAVVVGCIGIGYLAVRSFAASGSAQLYLTPASGSYTTGQSITVQVYVNTGGDPVNAVQADFSYPASKLSFQSIDSTGSAFGVDASSTGGNGTVSIAKGVIGQVTGTGLIATVHFNVTASGSAALTFLNSSHVVRSTDNTDILTTKTGASYTLSGAATPAPTPVPHTPTPAPVHTPTPAPGHAATPTPVGATPTPAATATPVAVAGGTTPTPSTTASPSSSSTPYPTPAVAAKSPTPFKLSGVLGVAAVGIPVIILLVLAGLALTHRQVSNIAARGADQVYTPPSATPPTEPQAPPTQAPSNSIILPENKPEDQPANPDEPK